jgi:glycosyltransferase involved in cell wall biosynthesis
MHPLNTSEETPLISVIMASYNHASYVEEAVATVLQQTADDLELIVVDDASSDGTADVVAGFDDPRLRLVRQQQNRAVHPRNLALGMARGRYVAIQNSDDAWALDKLARQIEYMQGNPHCVACFTGVELVDAYGKPASGTWADKVYTTQNRTSAQWLQHFFFHGTNLPLTSVLMRREVAAELGGFRACLIGVSDYDLWVRLAAKGELHIIDAPLTRVRILKGRNLGRPNSFAHINRSRIEIAHVLRRYAEPLLLERFPEIFPQWSGLQSEGARKVQLALAAFDHWSPGALFADMMFAEVLDDPEQRAQAVAELGAEFIRTAVKLRATYSFEQNGRIAWLLRAIKRRLKKWT